MRQLLTENLLLATMGTGAGLMCGYFSARYLLRALDAPPDIRIGMDWQILACGAAIDRRHRAGAANSTGSDDADLHCALTRHRMQRSDSVIPVACGANRLMLWQTKTCHRLVRGGDS